MASQTVASNLVDTLVEAGVERIYGIVGDSLNPITDAIRKNGKIQFIHVRHEEAGAFAAGAEAQLSGKLTVCAGSCGPGNLHLINGLFDAHRSMAPVVAIASHIPLPEIGKYYFQETHPQELFKECSHYCELVSSPKQMPRMLQIAIQHALIKGGVGVIVLPGDIAGMEIPADTALHPLFMERPLIRPSQSDILKLVNLLNKAKKVTLFCGSGCAGAHDELLALAEILKAPIGHAYRGKHFVEYDNPYDVGMTGLLGFGSAYNAMQECDLLLLLGTDFPYEPFIPTKCKIAQVDIRVDHLGRRSKVDLGLWGDVKETLHELIPLLKSKEDRSHLDKMLKEFQDFQKKMNIYIEHFSNKTPIHPEFATYLINKLASHDAIFTVDTGMCAVWAVRYIHMTKDRRILGSFNHGSMANALPQAIGAQCLYPHRQIIALCGDGGFAMLMGDVLTLLQHDLPIKIIIFNNGALGMVKLEMQVAGFPDWQTDLKNPNFAKMAEAIGIMGIRIEKPDDLHSGLQQALYHPGPVIVDIVTDPNALSLPPKITFKQVEGFALTMGKLVLSGHIDEVVETIESNIHNLK